MFNPVGIILWLLFIAFLFYVYENARDANNNANSHSNKNDTKNDNKDIGEDTYA